jgi:hypothetical protein
MINTACRTDRVLVHLRRSLEDLEELYEDELDREREEHGLLENASPPRAAIMSARIKLEQVIEDVEALGEDGEVAQ